MSFPTEQSHSNLDGKKKPELIAIIKQYRENEGLLLQEMQELKNEIRSIKDSLKEMKSNQKQDNIHTDIKKRTITIERRLAEQEQYSRRECVELVGLPQDTNGGELEELVVQAFETAGVHVQKRDFHAIHRMKDNKTVIAKLVNRRDSISILKKKKKLRQLNEDEKAKLKSSKIYINESLCRPYRQLLGKSNALYKKSYINSFYTTNGKIKIHFDGQHGEEISTITHVTDLYDIFGEEIMQEFELNR